MAKKAFSRHSKVSNPQSVIKYCKSKLVLITHQGRSCSLWAPASPSCGLVETCVGVSGCEDRGCVLVHSCAQSPPCELPARTAGRGIPA